MPLLRLVVNPVVKQRITCDACNSFLGVILEGRAGFWCRRCRKMVEVRIPTKSVGD